MKQLITKAELDQYGDYCKTLAPFKSTISAHKALRKKIAAAYEDQAADESFQAEGERWTVKLSPKTVRRMFKPGALKRLAHFLGDAFYKIAQVPLGEFEAHVTLPDRSKYIVESQTGYRTVEAVEKQA